MFQETEDAIELANKVIEMKPESYEAYYARAKANIDLRKFESALHDVKEAQLRAPPQGNEAKILNYLKEEITSKICSANRLANHRDFKVSVDVLHE